jgi:hypothetical protein
MMSKDSMTLETLVSNNKTIEAISKLIDLITELHEDPLKQLTVLSSRYKSSNNEVIGGRADPPTAKTEFSRIDYAFLNILSDVREAIQTRMNFYKSIPKEVGDEAILRGLLSVSKYVNNLT